jgi:GNAT superfamily N-acetyltransferase
VTPPRLDFDRLVRDLRKFKHAEMRADLTIDREAPNLVHVRGVVLDAQNEEVGRGISRTFFFRDGEGWEVRHEGLYLNPEAQCKGFGSAFEQYSMEIYRRAGVVQVSLRAEQIGSFAWRNLGYRLPSDPVVRRKQSVAIWTEHGGRSRAQVAVERGHVTQEQLNEIEELFSAIEQGNREPLEPFEIGDLGTDTRWEEDGRHMWLGRAILTNAKWTGIKELESH